ncbi:MAG TPA: condensation domain-containing protein, partial [Candidatus Deferrimicrobium sp.]|nr:condensation domain-containing protein [Candidatus Deferrimicrobium sp.]
ILKEFFRYYHELSKGEQSLQPRAKTPFKEFVKWVQNQDRNKQERFWKDYLAGFETTTGLPSKRRTEETTGSGDYAIILAEDIKNKLDVFIKNNRVTLASFFYTAWGALLQKYCGSEDIVFGTTVSGRSGGIIKGIEDMVGLFIYTIPLRIQTAPGEKIGDMLFRTDQVLREREAFENTPLVDIGSYGPVETNGPLFDTIVAIENYPLDKRLLPGGSLLSIHSFSMVEATHYDLSVGIAPFNEIEINFSYKPECFDKDDIKNLAGHFKRIIQNMIETPEAAVSQLEMISIEEKNRVLYEFNSTAAEYPKDKTIHRLFEEQVDLTPDHIAVFGRGRTPAKEEEKIKDGHLSYRELTEQSDRLAGFLIAKGVLADTIVGIMMEHSVEMIVGILGILKSGGAYLPIDPAYPQDRIDYMLKDSGAHLLVTSYNKESDKVRRWEDEKVLLKSIIHHSSHPSHLAYLIYTSGSTGKPKGVMVEHRSLVNLCFWHNSYYSVTSWDRATKYAGF